MRWTGIAVAAGFALLVGFAGCDIGGGDGGGDGTSGDGGPVDSGDAVDSRGCEPGADGGCECAYRGRTAGVCGEATVDPEGGTCGMPAGYEASEQSCADGVDNDCDGKTDCDDPGCAGDACGRGQGAATCVAGECVELVCFDGVDNDGDGKTDCADPDCRGETCNRKVNATCPPAEAYEPGGERTCDDGLDNDCDGATDETCGCTYDPNEEDDVDTDESHNAGVCTERVQNDQGKCPEPAEFEHRETSCADGIDNDCDGYTDCGDSNCVSEPCGKGKGGAICTTTRCKEVRCFDGIDNDEDGKADCLDEDGDCVGRRCDETNPWRCPAASAAEPKGEVSCDGIDNDCDGETDKGCPCAYDPNEPNNTDTDGDFSHGVCKGQTKDADAICSRPSGFRRRGGVEPCDSKDHDCDGVTDEGCPCDYNGTTKGVCSDGTVDASGTCQPPSDYDGSDEKTCDGKDNDCDGKTDEGCDDDGDGYCDETMKCMGGASCTCGDCYDQNAKAKPPQRSYFGTDRGDGSFDYNCDGTLEKRWTKLETNCSAPNRSTCNSKEGWNASSPPGCGASVDWIRCDWDYSQYSPNCTDQAGSRTQRCR